MSPTVAPPEQSTQESNAVSQGQRFAADSLLLISANSLAGLLYLLVHVVLGRHMTGVDYAALVALLGLLNVLGVGANSLQIAMARHTALIDEDDRRWMTLCRRVGRGSALWGGVALALWCVLATPLRAVLEAPSVLALIMLGIIAGLQLFQPLVQGLLQGLRLFSWIAASAVSGASARLLGALIVVLLGGSVAWVLGAFIAGALVALAMAAWPVAQRSSHRTSPDNAPDVNSRPLFGYLLWVMAGQVALFTLMNADLILAPRLLDGDTLGAYSKAAILARTVIFVPLPVVIAMFPRAVASGQVGIVAKPMAFVMLSSIGAALVLGHWPSLFLGWMYGPTEALAAPFAARYVWAVIPLALLEVAIPYLWARDRLGAAVTAAFPATIYVAALLMSNHQPFAMINTLAVAGVATLGWLLLMLLVLPSKPW